MISRPSHFAPSPRFLLILGIFIGVGCVLFAVKSLHGKLADALVLCFVLSGWLVVLCLHEGAHALTAYLGGDKAVLAHGYLTLDPLAYANPFLTFGLPILFILMGGLGLPGGAVWIDARALRSRWWDSAVSAAGPCADFFGLMLICLPFALGLHMDFGADGFWAALALLGFLQCSAIVINLLPIPGLDGFGIIKPFLPYDMQTQAHALANYMGLLLLLLLLAPPFTQAVGNMAIALGGYLGLDLGYVGQGYLMFRFRA